jgi:protein TonB
MRAISSAASVSLHVAAAAALLLGTTRKAETRSVGIDTLTALFPEPRRTTGMGVGVTGGIEIPRVESPDPATIRSLTYVLQPGALTPTFSSDWAPSSAVGRSVGAGGESGFVAEMAPEVLSGPLPLYPDLLRQAGVEGEVVLEARVDSTGRVQKGSVSVVFATNPGFVEPARKALVATLFRPARVNGRAVAMLVRVPFAFSIRGGTGRAR